MTKKRSNFETTQHENTIGLIFFPWKSTLSTRWPVVGLILDHRLWLWPRTIKFLLWPRKIKSDYIFLAVTQHWTDAGWWSVVSWIPGMPLFISSGQMVAGVLGWRVLWCSPQSQGALCDHAIVSATIVNCDAQLWRPAVMARSRSGLHHTSHTRPRKTRRHPITVQCRASVADAGPALPRHWESSSYSRGWTRGLGCDWTILCQPPGVTRLRGENLDICLRCNFREYW